MNNMLSSLEKMPRGSVLAFVCENMDDAFFRLSVDMDSHEFPARIITRRLVTLPSQTNLIDGMLDQLAETALDLWPRWYEMEQCFTSSKTGCTDELASDFLRIDELIHARLQVSKQWLKKAIQCCRVQKAPRIPEIAKTVEAGQLALAISPDRLVMILGVDCVNFNKNRLSGLAKSAEWFAKSTKAAVAVFIPEVLERENELETILYGSRRISSFKPWLARTQAEEENKILIAPVKGRPHPGSPGEKALFQALRDDAELTGLFSFNQTVKTIQSKSYLVDLVWNEGRILVEVDGYKYHSDVYTFRSDRQKDFEFLVSGYLVLRLAHDMIMEDVLREVEKIRQVVRFRKKSFQTKN